jgi:hypothetical protein
VSGSSDETTPDYSWEGSCIWKCMIKKKEGLQVLEGIGNDGTQW